MRTVRQITVILLLAVLLAPGLAQARTPVRHSAHPSLALAASGSGFFSMVWNLLTNYAKNGGQMDPNGAPLPPPPPSSSSTTDNGGQMDPNGVPK